MLALVNRKNNTAKIGPDSTFDEFSSFMSFVWDEADSADYRKWHDAKEVLRAIGARRTGGSTTKKGENPKTWEWWMLPGGTKIKVLGDGSGIQAPKRKFGLRIRKGAEGSQGGEDDKSI